MPQRAGEAPARLLLCSDRPALSCHRSRGHACPRSLRFAWFAPLLLIQLLKPAASGAIAPTCSAKDGDEIDPNLHRMYIDIGYGEEVFDAYVEPDVSTFYREVPGSRATAQPKFVGLAGKFVNMSPKRLKLYWDPKDGSPGALIGGAEPFQSVGTASFPGHKFFFAEFNNIDSVVKRFTVEKGKSVYYFDPYEVVGDPKQTSSNLETLDFDEYQKYERQKRSQWFNDKYREFTGRDYLAIYPRDQPSFFLWPADYFGQQHWVTTKETHFVTLPPDEKLTAITSKGKERVLKDDELRLLQEYRTDDLIMKMTLNVLSCAPRAFEINNFLSEVEVDHIMKLAGGMDLAISTTGQGIQADSRKTRTSMNTWVSREKSPIIDSLYRRAADLLRLDEALLRNRDSDEYPDLGSKKNIAEPLQLVHYGVGQEYTAHHDFGYKNSNDETQGQRFATLLLYLNEPKQGGETSFPRWKNAGTSEALKVKPEKGKAVLFYSILPDGNFDDFSQHAAVPVSEGEKWLINLWVRDPFFD